MTMQIYMTYKNPQPEMLTDNEMKDWHIFEPLIIHFNCFMSNVREPHHFYSQLIQIRTIQLRIQTDFLERHLKTENDRDANKLNIIELKRFVRELRKLH